MLTTQKQKLIPYGYTVCRTLYLSIKTIDADPENFDRDLDPTSEKTGSGSESCST
jgi:hypothetical protein